MLFKLNELMKLSLPKFSRRVKCVDDVRNSDEDIACNDGSVGIIANIVKCQSTSFY